MIEMIPDRTIVNHAPWGTFVRAEDMYTASRVPKKRKNAVDSDVENAPTTNKRAKPDTKTAYATPPSSSQPLKSSQPK